MAALKFEHQESVTDEELFGEGRGGDDCSGKTQIRRLENDNKVSGRRVTFDDDTSQTSDNIDTNVLPNFNLLELTSSSDEDEKKKDLDTTNVTATEIESKHGDNDFKERYRSKGSISSIEEKRRQYRDRLDIEVFESEFMYEEPKPNQVRVVRKSNSLPDLILSSSSSLSPSSRFHSDGSNHDPDVTNVTVSAGSVSNKTGKDLQDKKSKKEAFEGQSSFKAKQKELSSNLQSTEETILEQVDEGFGDQNNEDDKHNPEDQDKTVGRKRELYSRSSGYLTGSESQDKSKGSMQSQTSTVAYSEASSEPWISNDIQNEIQKDKEINFGNIPLMSGFTNTSIVYNSCTEESGSSRTTVVSANSKTSQGCTDREDSNEGEPGTKNSKEGEPGTKDDTSLTFSRLKTESYTEDESALTHGNVPNLDVLDSSVCVGPSTINQINNEENENFMKQTVQRFNNGSLGQGSLMPSSGPRSSCADSINVKKDQFEKNMLEDLMKKGEDPLEILRNFQASESSTPSPSPADISRVISPGQKFTCNCLQRASRCQKKDCSDKACKQFAFINMALEKEILPVAYECDMVRQYGTALWQHHRDCEELWCKVKYCQLIDLWELVENDTDGLIACLQRKLREPVMEILTSNRYTFHKIRDKDCSLHGDDLESVIPLSTIGTFGSALLCLDKSQHMCVVKEYALFDYQHQASLYRRLCEKHPYVVDQMWLVEYETQIQICSDFMPGGSLFDYMRAVGPLTWQSTMMYIQQMLSALTFLHKNGIVYLNWTSGNMLFSDTSYQRIKINNFSLSFPLGVQYDLGSVKQCLPPNIIPPELLQENGKVDVQSDIWGVGCQMYELLTGEPVWSNHRHESREYIHKKICNKVPSYPANLTPQQNSVFTACWQINPQDRYTTEKLYDLITKISQNH